jgi:hypothetical protein
MYYICKFSDSWSLYDGKKNISRQLNREEVECMKNLFPGLTGDTGKILMAIQVSSINPNKLLQLPNPENQGILKKEKG